MNDDQRKHNTEDEQPAPKQRSVSELRNWLSNFGEKNRGHYEKGHSREVRPPCIHRRIQKFEVSLCSSSSISSATSNDDSPNLKSHESPSLRHNKRNTSSPPSPDKSNADGGEQDKRAPKSPQDFRIVTISQMDAYSPRRDAPGRVSPSSSSSSSSCWGRQALDPFFPGQWPEQTPPGLTPPRAPPQQSLVLNDTEEECTTPLMDNRGDMKTTGGTAKHVGVTDVDCTATAGSNQRSDDSSASSTDPDGILAEQMKVSSTVERFGGSNKLTAVQRRREALERKWAEDRAPTHSKKIQWHASNGTYKKKVVLKVHK